MNKWMNFLAVIVILIIAVVLVFFLQPPQNFNSPYTQMKNIWISQGFAKEALHADFAALTALPADNLSKIKIDLEKNASASSQPAIKDLAPIYSKLTDAALLFKAINQKSESLSTSATGFCELLQEYTQLNAQMQALNNDFTSLSANIDNFIQKHPAEAGEIDLFSIKGQNATLAQNLANQNQVIQLAGNECA